MLVCNVSLRPPRSAIAAGITETAAAVDATTTGNVVFATLVDDPASVAEFVDAYLGEIMLEAATADDVTDAGFAQAAALAEAGAGADTLDATISTVPLTTWNPADKSANITLSNANLTAQITTTSDGAVRSTTARPSGKVYFEITWSSNLGGGDTGCGIATSAAVLSSVGSAAANACLVFVSGNIYFNGSNVSNITVGAPPFTICVALDLVNSRIWFRSGAGNWNNSGTANPATNVGGINIATLFPANAAYALMAANGNTTPTYTANFGASTFAQSVPSGFVAWN